MASLSNRRVMLQHMLVMVTIGTFSFTVAQKYTPFRGKKMACLSLV